MAVDITHNDGEVDHGEQSECRYDSKGALAPDAYREHTTNAEGNQVNHSGVAAVDVRPILAVFQDGSSESTDKASFHHLMDGVKNDAEGTRMVLSTLQKSTNDPAKAVASLEEQRKYAAPQSLYDRQLRDAIAFLKKSPAPSGNIEREFREGCGKRSGRSCKDGSRHEMGASGGPRIGTARQEDRQIPRQQRRFTSTLKNSGVDCRRLPRPCRNPDWQPVLRRQEVGALALIYRKHV